MKQLIDGGMKIADILTHYPETSAVFQAHGFGRLTTTDGMRILAPFLTLATALRNRNIDIYGFIALLEEAIRGSEILDAPGLDTYEEQGDLSLLALMPCGLKMSFGKALTAFLNDLKAKEKVDIRFAVEGNVNQELSYYAYVQTLEEVDELPDIIVSADFNAFYGKKFYDKFVASGHFVGYGEPDPSPAFISAGIMDPLQHYSILGINPLVMVANLDEVGDRPLPSSWQDILHPQWQKSIVLRGNADFFCHAVLLPTYKRYGREGLEKLAANVLCGLHPAEMVKRIDAGKSGAIYVMPEFFAQRIKRKEKIQIIWPEDGALASPLTLQVKKSRVKELRPVLDFLTGLELAQILNTARFPVPHAAVAGEVQEKPLLWPGWDFFRKNDLLEVNEKIDRIFLPLATHRIVS